MRTIFKTKLDICDFQTVELPQDFKILHIAKQNGVPCIWYECESTMPLAKLDGWVDDVFQQIERNDHGIVRFKIKK